MRFTNLLSVHPLGMRAAVPYQAQPSYQARARYEAQRPRSHFMRAAPITTCALARDGTFATNDACMSATQCGWKFKCDGAGACFQAQDGTYATSQECLAACATKWACDGFGGCVPNAAGQYNTQAECKCYSCQNGQCLSVAKNATGVYANQNDCINDPVAQCGWNFKCASVADGGAPDTFTLKVPSNQGTYATTAAAKCVSAIGAAGPSCVCGYNPAITGDAAFNNITQCNADTTAMCGWKYGCGAPLTLDARNNVGGTSVVYAGGAWTSLSNLAYNSASPTVPLRFLIAQNANIGTMSKVTTDGVTFADAGYGVKNLSDGGSNSGAAKFKYYPMFIFTAIKPFVTLNSGGTNMRIAFGDGDDRGEAETVLIPWGNYDGISPDPPAVPGVVTRSVGGRTFSNVPIRTDVLGSAGSPQFISGRGTTNWAPGFSNKKVQVRPGYQYAIAVQGFVATNDYVYFSWQEFPSDKLSVTFTDS